MMAAQLHIREVFPLASPQTFRNHARFDPPLHFFILPVLLLNVFVAVGVLIHDWPSRSLLHIWLIVVSVALLLLGPVGRLGALRAQDRLIRLEETLRHQRLLSPEYLTATNQLTLRQLIALRFASDDELPHLVQRAAGENMTPKAIKEAIQVWRTDPHRV